jgi:hypothetical protein
MSEHRNLHRLQVDFTFDLHTRIIGLTTTPAATAQHRCAVGMRATPAAITAIALPCLSSSTNHPSAQNLNMTTSCCPDTAHTCLPIELLPHPRTLTTAEQAQTFMKLRR